jgi:hypothetical protein
MVVNSTGTFIAYGTAPDNPQNVSGPTGFHSNITSVTLNTVTGTTGTPTTFGTDTIVVEEIFCVGTLACTATDEVTLEGEIAASGSSAVTYTCTKGSGVTAADGTCATVAGTSATFTFGTGFPSVPTINLVSTYTLTTSGTSDTGNTDSLTKFADVFGEDEISPEPSTFILLGSALALIGLLRLRARRKSAAAAIL